MLQHERAESRAGWMFITPALVLIGVFFVIPVLGALVLSFTDFDIYSIGNPADTRFIGLGNYRSLFADPLFWKALRNTAYYVVVGGPLSVVVSLAAALLVNARLIRWKPLFRSAFFAPWLTTRWCGATSTIRSTACSTRSWDSWGWGRSIGSATRAGPCPRSS